MCCVAKHVMRQHCHRSTEVPIRLQRAVMNGLDRLQTEALALVQIVPLLRELPAVSVWCPPNDRRAGDFTAVKVLSTSCRLGGLSLLIWVGQGPPERAAMVEWQVDLKLQGPIELPGRIGPWLAQHGVFCREDHRGCQNGSGLGISSAL